MDVIEGLLAKKKAHSIQTIILLLLFVQALIKQVQQVQMQLNLQCKFGFTMPLTIFFFFNFVIVANYVTIIHKRQFSQIWLLKYLNFLSFFFLHFFVVS